MGELSDSAMAYFPGQALFYLFKGISALGRKEYGEALKILKKGQAIPGQNPEVTKQFYITMAEAWYKTGEKEEAFKSFEQLLAIDPENTMVLNNYAYYLSLEDRDLDKALTMIGKCIGLEKENATFLDTYAWVLYKRKDYKNALDVIEKVMKLENEHSGEVMEHYGDILFMNGRIEDARNAWRNAEGKEGATPEITNKIKNGLK
jgi:tetratricopeptide (TPR) repeat protein